MIFISFVKIKMSILKPIVNVNIVMNRAISFIYQVHCEMSEFT
jgi:hypothetical protein